jgi:hypothetical protein
VERRQASAPAAEGRRKPTYPWRDRTRWCGHETLRLSAFRFLYFFLPFVIAGLDPAIHAATTLRQSFGLAVCNRTSAWTTGSSPVVTTGFCRCLTLWIGKLARHRAARTLTLIRPRDSGGGGPSVAPEASVGWWRGRLTRRFAFVAGKSSRPAPLPPRKCAAHANDRRTRRFGFFEWSDDGVGTLRFAHSTLACYRDVARDNS